MHQEGSYSPVGFGILAFALLMIWLTLVALPQKKRKLGWILATVGGLTAVFTYALMFLLLNIYGS